MPLNTKLNKWILFFLIVLIIFTGSYYIYFKFFPSQSGKWIKNLPVTEEIAMPTSGWENDVFWTTLDFPGEQSICLKVKTRTNDLPVSASLSAVQTSRAALYPTGGTINDLFLNNSLAAVEENIILGKPFLLNNWPDRVTREGKDILFRGTKDKFLIPTKRIFSTYFPQLEIPPSAEGNSPLYYSNVIINYPEGVLLSDGKGVFVISGRQLFLIKSPQIFESLGYKWEDIRQMNEFEQRKNQHKQGNLFDFESYHPNGTIIEKNGEYFFVWLNKKYSLSREEITKYFPAQPVVAVKEKPLKPDCKENRKVITCCLSNLDPRLQPPAYFPFSNTIVWNISQTVAQKDIEQINWQSQIAPNKENVLRRIGSLKNYLFYTLGFAK
ncbi:MAG: hypothetical protein FJZ04_03220 [Candidatus Moranbacteria bacterium]|nr:hypothetical protein [Candidatus Moranbacteria bacterium]